MIEQEMGTIVSASSIYETEPWGFAEQNGFLNQVIEVKSNLNPDNTLKKVLEIEQAMGRKREVKWGPRIIDIDLLLIGDAVFNTKNLSLPHPEMHKRRFVMEPLAEIAPDTIHPVFKKSVADLYKALTDPLTVKKR